LTRESAADCVNADSVGSQSLCRKFANVIIAWYVGPVLCEDGSAIGVDFTESGGFESTSSFESKAESSDATEQVK
jgi:hypothetical protein